MKKWVVRFATLYVFNLAVLLVIDLLVAGVSVGWGVLWASVILTAAVLWVKPLIHKWFTGMAARSAGQRTKAGEWLVRAGLVFLVELIVWVIVVMLSGVQVRHFFLGYLLPPVLLLIAWAIYAAIDDRLEARAGDLFDRASAGIGRGRTDAAAPVAPPSAEARAAREELQDGLTAEQRRMLDELG
ncbi:hypothetical protein G5T42_02110 [Microbacterium sp. 4R-513]|uniref:hypothetical protein n=1 Tax=Microbacterium sp. 4R-513 TaxID=2567934 RepID=UPI0013E1685E|nr:hypothetical protein [Microbacterium sp. 4R-513]QIG38418.1 hypothetical protein G5T42_02110 [Microbacterium sp. 4R-513]